MSSELICGNRTPRTAKARFVPALRFHWATGLYDLVMRFTMRENSLRIATLEHVGPLPNDRILDLGCGTGALTLGLATAAPGVSVMGFDIDEQAIAIARTKTKGTGADIRFELGSVTDVNSVLALQSFDHVVSSLLFHHLTRSQNLNFLLATCGKVRRRKCCSIFIQMEELEDDPDAEYESNFAALMFQVELSVSKTIDGFISNFRSNSRTASLETR